MTRLLPRLLAWHRWWFRDRDPERTGLVVTFHPWESGLDNSPAWDAPLRAVPPATRPYARKDTGWVDPARRPRQADYDRYVFLLDFFRQAKFDPANASMRECPYRVADFGLNAILRRAQRKTWPSFAAATASMPPPRKWTRRRTFPCGRALDGLWSEEHGAYLSRDTRAGRLLMAACTHSTFLAWYGRMAAPPPRAGPLAPGAAGQTGWPAPPLRLPSTHPDAPEFEAQRYWRGPVWPHMNWLIAVGLAEAGHRGESARLAEATRALIASGGLCEYFDPLPGEGCGGGDFSWTAATVLFWLAAEPAS